MPTTVRLTCVRCGEPRGDCSSPSYCRPCHRELGRQSRARLGGKKPQANCSRCGKIRDGRHASYCVECFKAYREEQRRGPCSRCGEVRNTGDLTNSTYCYKCWRNWWLQRKYGLTGDDYDRMLEEQGNTCAICKSNSNGRMWHVDHCHKTGVVRGILCDNCNRGIGHLKDDSQLLRRAADYLERN